MTKILVIDDDAMVRTTIRRILEQGGYDVTMTDDGSQGITAFRQEQPSLVITDIIMPHKEGMETILQMRRECPDIKIIAISGGGRLDNADILRIARNLGANDTIAKPFLPHQLLDSVANCLAAV